NPRLEFAGVYTQGSPLFFHQVPGRKLLPFLDVFHYQLPLLPPPPKLPPPKPPKPPPPPLPPPQPPPRPPPRERPPPSHMDQNRASATPRLPITRLPPPPPPPPRRNNAMITTTIIMMIGTA